MVAIGNGAVQGLVVYPIKSCGGVSVRRALVTRTGLRLDREWMLVDATSRRFLSQRSHPGMATIRVDLPEPAFTLDGDLEGFMHVSCPGASDALRVPLTAPPLATALENAPQASVWEWTGRVHDEGEDAARWFSEALGTSCRLVRMPPCDRALGIRATDAAFPPVAASAFSDGFPFLLTHTASLEALNSAMAGDGVVAMNRFRPNVVVAGDGWAPWDEDTWDAVSLENARGDGAIRLSLVKPCSRCKVTTVDQTTGEVAADGGTLPKGEPLRALSRMHSGAAASFAEAKWARVPFFGWNAVVDDSGGAAEHGRFVSVGDTVRITPRAAPGPGRAA